MGKGFFKMRMNQDIFLKDLLWKYTELNMRVWFIKFCVWTASRSGILMEEVIALLIPSANREEKLIPNHGFKGEGCRPDELCISHSILLDCHVHQSFHRADNGFWTISITSFPLVGPICLTISLKNNPSFGLPAEVVSASLQYPSVMEPILLPPLLSSLGP